MLEALLTGIVDDPAEEARWLVLADYLEENDDPRRAELLRLHRRLVGTCCEPDAHPDRAGCQARVVELLVAGIDPCVPRHTLVLPGGVPLVGAFVPPGSFLMGGTETDFEKPVHRVTLTTGQFVGIYPVTQAQWKAVMKAGPRSFKGSNKPVDRVSWNDCQKFCDRLSRSQNGRAEVYLPTEAEWEWACRAGTSTDYFFGDVFDSALANCDRKRSWNNSPPGPPRQAATDVGTFPPNAWGLFDLHGNVSEWCRYNFFTCPGGERFFTIYDTDEYSYAERGGSCHSGPADCRSASRGWQHLANRNTGAGFRVAFRLH